MNSTLTLYRPPILSLTYLDVQRRQRHLFRITDGDANPPKKILSLQEAATIEPDLSIRVSDTAFSTIVHNVHAPSSKHDIRARVRDIAHAVFARLDALGIEEAGDIAMLPCNAFESQLKHGYIADMACGERIVVDLDAVLEDDSDSVQWREREVSARERAEAWLHTVVRPSLFLRLHANFEKAATLFSQKFVQALLNKTDPDQIVLLSHRAKLILRGPEDAYGNALSNYGMFAWLRFIQTNATEILLTPLTLLKIEHHACVALMNLLNNVCLPINEETIGDVAICDMAMQACVKAFVENAD
jgi:hypothetical protein